MYDKPAANTGLIRGATTRRDAHARPWPTAWTWRYRVRDGRVAATGKAIGRRAETEVLWSRFVPVGVARRFVRVPRECCRDDGRPAAGPSRTRRARVTRPGWSRDRLRGRETRRVVRVGPETSGSVLGPRRETFTSELSVCRPFRYRDRPIAVGVVKNRFWSNRLDDARAYSNDEVIMAEHDRDVKTIEQQKKKGVGKGNRIVSCAAFQNAHKPNVWIRRRKIDVKLATEPTHGDYGRPFSRVLNDSRIRHATPPGNVRSSRTRFSKGKEKRIKTVIVRRPPTRRQTTRAVNAVGPRTGVEIQRRSLQINMISCARHAAGINDKTYRLADYGGVGAFGVFFGASFQSIRPWVDRKKEKTSGDISHDCRAVGRRCRGRRRAVGLISFSLRSSADSSDCSQLDRVVYRIIITHA